MSVQLQAVDPVEVEPEFVQYEVADRVATIWLNRPEVKNCVNWDADSSSSAAALERAERDPDVRVVLIRGRGHTFCAGADLKMLDADFLGTTNNSVEIAQVSARIWDRRSIWPKPTVAVVEGYAVAGGFELMISCDFAVVADDAKIGDFHIRRALFGGAGPIYRLPRYIGLRRTKELLMTGKLLSGLPVRRLGTGERVRPSRRAGSGGRRVHRADEGQERVHDADHEAGRESRPRRRHRDADRARESMTCNVAHQSNDAREGVQAFLAEARSRLDRQLSGTADHGLRP